MYVYLIVAQTDKGIKTRIGGGSSTPASVRLYESLPKAKAALKRLRNDGRDDRVILEIDLSNCTEVE